MTFSRRRFLQFQLQYLAASAAAPLVSGIASAQNYPSRPIRFVVPFPSGGVSDIIARHIGQKLSDRLGQSFVIEDRGGAGSNLGTEIVVNAPADGYTLLLDGSANAVNATLYPNLGFSYLRDISPVASMFRAPHIMEVNPSFPARTVPEFIAYARSRPGQINMASAGTGTISHMAGELFKMMTGIALTHVPYRGAAPALTDLLGGHVQVMFDNAASSTEHIRAGRLRALAVTTATRMDVLPEVPTVGEFLPGYEASNVNGIGVPAKTPIEIVAKLNADVGAILGGPVTAARFADLGGAAMIGSPADYRKFLADETEKCESGEGCGAQAGLIAHIVPQSPVRGFCRGYRFMTHGSPPGVEESTPRRPYTCPLTGVAAFHSTNRILTIGVRVMTSIDRQIARELGVRDEQVAAAVALLDGGATVPFIARYRKEATGALDDAQLRALDERLRYLRELEERRTAILNSIREQGKLDDSLEAAIRAADSKGRLEDIYLPFRPKRRTKAEIAKEAGLEPLADLLLTQPQNDPQVAAARFVDADKQVADVAAALDGARSILVERFAEDADLIGSLREEMWSVGRLASKVRDGKRDVGAKFSDYFDFTEKLTKVPSHRILALFRAEKEEILDVAIAPEDPAGASGGSSPYELRIMRRFGIGDRGRPSDKWLMDTARWAWRTKIQVHLGIDLRMRLWNAAEQEAVRVFAANLRDLLLAAPAGARATMGLDPGYRTGVKVAVVDATGKVVATSVIYPHEPQRRWDEALAILGKLGKQHDVELISIGNGTASRETDKLATELVKLLPDLKMSKIVVSEAGASVYSASAYASEELPDLDVTLRGAVSIARRLQDPLAELVKIDPKSIGVGQYQHDLSEHKLSRSLDAVVEDCVNAVGVDANTASAPLLARVSGIGAGLAQNIVLHRDANGPFRSRKALKGVPRLGPKAFEQCAGFLRIAGGEDPLDASGVHPEAYPVVRRIIQAAKTDIKGLIGNAAALRALSPNHFVDDTFGLPTVTDILRELEKPGRDPRPAFRAAVFMEGVETLGDLKPGMVLEGAVTNVAAFGAFVDIGVHQDGLVHVSAMSKTFVKDPREVVKPGDIVRVKVLEVDVARKRIALTLRLDDEVGPRADRAGTAPPRNDGARAPSRSRAPAPREDQGGGALADALRRAGLAEKRK